MVVISCKPKDERQELTFKPEIELKELATWVMGFTCKNFVLLTPQEAYRAFLVALSTMGLAIVPKGNLLRIHEERAQRDALDTKTLVTPGGL